MRDEMKEPARRLKHLVDKMMVDKAFYEKLKKDPSGALQEIKTKATPKEIEALKKVDYELLEEVSKAFGDFVT